MSRALAWVGIVTVGAFMLFLLGYLFLPRLAACALFCSIVWN